MQLNRRYLTRRRSLWQMVAAGVAALALMVGAAWIVRSAHRAHANAERCQTIHDLAQSYGAIRRGAGPEHIAVIGDSYAAGDTLTDPAQSWAHLAAGAIAGVGGSGWIHAGPCGDNPFLARTQPVMQRSPKVLIVQGGLNDTTEDPGDVRAAASKLLAQTASVPVVVVVGPPDVPAREGEDRVDAALRQATEGAGRQYVSLLHEPLELGPDHLHPTRAGHAELAALLSTAIRGS